MKQIGLGLNLSTKKTRKAKFLDDMERVVPWAALVAMRPGKRRKLNPFIELDFVAERVEKMKASIRAKVKHPLRVIKRQFGFTKVRYRGLAKNTA